MSGTSVPYLLDKAAAGERLYFDETLLLYREADLVALGRAASAARDGRVPGRVVTYLVDCTISYTNVCVTRCQFCAFSRSPGHPEAFVTTREELGKKIDELIDQGGTCLVLQGGHNPALNLDWYTDLLRWLRRTYPSIELDCFSPSEIAHLAQVSALSVREVLRELQAAGLQGLPGDGAEILEDEIRERFAPRKQKTDGWLSVMREAQKVGLNTTATMVIGFDELLEQRVRHLQRLRDLQDYSLRTHGNGFHAFRAWTLQQPNRTRTAYLQPAYPYHAMPHDYLRHVAIARLFLDNIPHHQATWSTQGTQMSQAALAFGVDDFGGIAADAVFVPASTAGIGSHLSAERVHTLIRAAGFVPAQRDTMYNLLEVFDEPADVLASRAVHDQPGACLNIGTHEVIPSYIIWN